MQSLEDLVDDLDDAEVVGEAHERRLAGEIAAADVVPKRKRGKGTSPTQRSLKYLRKQGCALVAVTEKWNPHMNAGRGGRQDLFGVIDVLAVRDDAVIAVQCCSTDVAGHVTKMVEATFKNPELKTECLVLPALFGAGIKVYVHGWRKNSVGKWILREVELS